MQLEDTKHAADYIAHAMMMAGTLYAREGDTPRLEVDQIVEILERDHEATLDALGLELPDTEDSAAVFSVVERLLVKYSRKALNAWTTKRQ